ncbi:hypothetical protein M2390_000496 [Mycetocola sp. BIGb0189]|uniref:hypothetical protein n=1 Tax=Mycetocola sp. BIGb0189 TaxID=2940604 RepID=UPI002167B5F4|nr:hypothetical protein [Mycetocola sp. BIGb0189]MCS4275335.1 hypothetical protein [Mycetocola sp. BIGb0189]
MAKTKTKVKLKRSEWGRQVTGSAGMEEHVAGLARQVAARLPGSTVKTEVTKVVGGGYRARGTVTTKIPFQTEVDTGEALAALQAVVPSGHKSNGNTGATRRRRAATKQSRKRGSAIIKARRKAKGAS